MNKARFQRTLFRFNHIFTFYIWIMRKIIIILSMLFVNESHVVAQPKFEQLYGSEKDYKRLWYLNIQYIQSWVRSDTGTYDKLLWAEDFVHQSGADGFLYPKKEIMPIFGKKRFDEIDYFYADNTTIKFITDTVAMVFSKPVYRGINDNEESLSRYNDVYVKRYGSWVCVSANITNVSPEGNKLLTIKKIPPKTNFVTVLNGSKEDMAEIKRLNNLIKDAFNRQDAAEAAELLDSEFMLLERNGSLFSKKQILESFKLTTNNNKYSYTIENFFIRFVETNVAMAHGVLLYKLADGGIGGVQFNDIYVKRGSVWKCVSINNTGIKN